MSERLIINPKTGLVDNPVYPCYKGEGLCRLRTTDTGEFECVFESKDCHFRRKGEGVDVTNI